MTTLHPCETTTPATGWTAIVNATVGTVEKAVALLRAWQNRREMYRLGEMSDIQLSDIGLTRSDLYVAREVPVNVDPTLRLGALADMNRTQRLARCIS